MRVISQKLRDSARDESCTLRLDGCLNGNETVVLCHAPGTGMKGIGLKVPDIFSMYGCESCHAVIDGRKKGDWYYQDILRAMCETQMRMIEKGLITIKGMK